MTIHKALTAEQAQAKLLLLTQDDIEPALGELQRELSVREHCYPRWVTEGKLSRIDAKDRMSRQIMAVEIVDLVLDTVLGRPNTDSKA